MHLQKVFAIIPQSSHCFDFILKTYVIVYKLSQCHKYNFISHYFEKQVPNQKAKEQKGFPQKIFHKNGEYRMSLKNGE